MNSRDYMRNAYADLGAVAAALQMEGHENQARLVKRGARLIWTMHDMLEQGINVAELPEIEEAGGVDHWQASNEQARHMEETEREQETDVPVSQLVTGDSVFSESAGTWHDVRVDGQALFLKRGESWVNMSHLPRDTVFRTRRGASGRAAALMFDNFEGEVIRDGLGR